MSSQNHRRRLRVLHHLARLGTATTRELAVATSLSTTDVWKLLCHRWFEQIPEDHTPQFHRYRLSEEGKAAEASAQGKEPSA